MNKSMKLALVSGFGAVLLAQAPAMAEKGAFRQGQKQETEAHFRQQQEENKAFRESLKGKPVEQRVGEIKAHRAGQYGENKEFFAKQHEENMQNLQGRLAKSKLSDAQKTEIAEFFATQYGENVSFREERYSTLMAEFDRIVNDSSLDQAAKKDAIRKAVAEWRAKTEAHHRGQQAEREAERGKFRKQP